MISVVLTYRGGGKDDSSTLVNFILHAMGAHGASYNTTADSCGSEARDNVPPFTWPVVYSGQSVRGTICFQIAANDANSLALYSTGKGNLLISYPTVKTVWFALRKH